MRAGLTPFVIVFPSELLLFFWIASYSHMFKAGLEPVDEDTRVCLPCCIQQQR